MIIFLVDINHFNNIEPELLTIFLGFHKKCATYNIRLIQDRHFWCISLPRFLEVSSLGRFSSMGENFPVHNSLKNNQDLTHFDYLCLENIYKGVWIPTNRVKAKVGLHGFLSKTKVRTK